MIDLRSDLLAEPTEEMWEAMRAAELGWATFGEDASVNELSARVAELLGKPAALWVPTCGMANLVALLTFGEPGDAVVLDSASHILTSEAWGIEEIARLEPMTLWDPAGRLDPVEVDQLVADTYAILLVLENTHTRAGGTVLSVELTEALAAAAKRHDCRVHVDGARLLNAAVALGVTPAALAAPANSVSLSMTKAIGAPTGAVLAGSDAVVERGREMLRRLGGASVHRAGIPAAAALVGLEGWETRVAEDHRRAAELAQALGEIPGLRLDPETVETNIVLVDVMDTGLDAASLGGLLREAGVGVLERDTIRIRLVTHRGISDDDIAEAARIVGEVVDRHRSEPVVFPDVEGVDELDDAL